MSKDNKSLLESLRNQCARRELSSYDIGIKLERAGVAKSDQLLILDSLREEGYIDDLRYARAFVNDQTKLRGWGPIKIRFALKGKEIDDSAIEEALELISIEEQQQILRKILQQKFRSLNHNEPKERQRERMIRFAFSRGYEYKLSYEIIKEIID